MKVRAISWLGLAWLLLGRVHFFSDDVTHDGSSKINPEVYRNILSANLKRWNQTDREILHHAGRQRPKTHCQNNQGVHQGKEVEGFRMAMSIS